MACIVYQTNKSNGHMYAYHAVSFRDPITKRPKSKRTFIGRVDPKTKQFLYPSEAARRLSALEPVSNLNLDITDSDIPQNKDSEKILSELNTIKEQLESIKSKMKEKDNAVQAIWDALSSYIKS